MLLIYVLELNEGYYYVGITENLNQRLDNHMKGNGAWAVQEFGFKNLIEVRVNGSKEMERDVTLEYKDKYGWDRVFGAEWCSVQYAVDWENPDSKNQRKREWCVEINTGKVVKRFRTKAEKK